jgi:hypothetical protein
MANMPAASTVLYFDNSYVKTGETLTKILGENPKGKDPSATQMRTSKNSHDASLFTK